MTESRENLKKRVLTTSHEMNGSREGISSGAVTPISMEKTDSVINLTRPSMYSIFNENSETTLDWNADDDEDDALYIVKTNVTPSPEAIEPVDTSFRGPIRIIMAKTLIKLGLLGVCAYIYNEFTSHLRNSHIKLDRFTFEPLNVTEILLTSSLKSLKPLTIVNMNDPWINYLVVVFIQGSIMGIFHPIMDFIIPNSFNKRILSSNPNPKKTSAGLVNDVLRSFITFLGIVYAIRHIEWNSQLQVSVVWSLLSPCLWLILDGTIGGLVASLAISIYGCLFIYFTNRDLFIKFSPILNLEEVVPIWLWTGSFFFCGLIIFGTLGRALF